MAWYATGPGSARRIGRDALIDAGADLLARPLLADLLSFAGVRAVAEQADVRPGTVTHRFPTASSANRRANPALAEAIARRAVSRGLPESGHTIDALPVELENLATGDSTALHRIARAMARDLLAHHDDHGQSFLTALFACVAVAPHDPDAAGIVRDYYAAVDGAFAGLYEVLAELLGRRFITGFDAASVGVALWALADGYAVRLRGDPDNVDPFAFAETAMRLFEALTTDASNPEEPTRPADVVLAPDGPDRRHRQAIITAARETYDRHGSWDLVTRTVVATQAGVGRAMVAATFPEWGGLAAAVWAPHLAPLREALDGDRQRPLDEVLGRHLCRLTDAARLHPQLASAYLEGVVRAAVTRGELDERDPTDPRAMLPLPQLLVRVLYDHAGELRPAITDTPVAALGYAGVLTRHTIDLALTAPVMTAAEVATAIVSFALDGVRHGPGAA